MNLTSWLKTMMALGSWKTRLLLSLLCLLVCAVSMHGVYGAQCMPDNDSPCKAHCNGTDFDLSKVFDFPMNISEPGPRFDGRTYWYMWSPCTSYKCPGFEAGKDCAICQKADFFYDCGQTARPIWLWDDWESGQDRFPNWQVQYTFGTTWRIAIVDFIVDKNQKEPKVSFISEHPSLQYNFKVRGACIGQQTFECQKYYKSRHSS